MNRFLSSNTQVTLYMEKPACFKEQKFFFTAAGYYPLGDVP
jgi:hypothetical protein